MPDCCDKHTQAVADGRLRYDGRQWHTVSSSVFMLTKLKFCGWCGSALPVIKRRSKPLPKEIQNKLFYDES